MTVQSSSVRAGRRDRARSCALSVMGTGAWRDLLSLKGCRSVESSRAVHRVRVQWDLAYGDDRMDMLVGIMHQADSSNDVARVIWMLTMLAEHGTLNVRETR